MEEKKEQKKISLEDVVKEGMRNCANTGHPTILNFSVKDSFGVDKPISLVITSTMKEPPAKPKLEVIQK